MRNDDKVMRKRTWQLLAFLERFLIGDRNWGTVRLLTVVAVTLVFILLGRSLFGEIDTRSVIERWQFRNPGLALIPKPVLVLFANLLLAKNMRYLVIPLAAVTGAILVGARYVQDIYELKDYRLALRYLVATLFSMNYPKLTIKDGEKQIEKGEVNLLDVIGGPGIVEINPGNVVLFERLLGPTNVRAHGKHFIPRGERIKEIADLEDQHGYIQETMAATKDGIPVVVRDIEFRYRLRIGRKYGDYAKRTPVEPYPFSVQAVRNMTYNRSVREDGLVNWHRSVARAMSGAVTGFIRQKQLDDLTAFQTEDRDPRADIANKITAKGVRERLSEVGAELIWFDIGHIDIPDEAKGFIVSKWGEKWRGDAKLVKSTSKAVRLQAEEQAVARFQSDLLIKIGEVLEKMDLTGDTTLNLRRIFLTKSAQIIEAMGKREIDTNFGENPGPG
jgi:hypothetical protein